MNKYLKGTIIATTALLFSACGNNADVSKFGLKLIEEQEDTTNREINHSRTECIEKVK